MKFHLNLRRKGYFSIIGSTGKVEGYCDDFVVKNATFHINHKARLKIRNITNRKSLHAWVKYTEVAAMAEGECLADHAGWTELYYSPYNSEFFCVKETGKELLHCDYVWAKDWRIYGRGITLG